MSVPAAEAIFVPSGSYPVAAIIAAVALGALVIALVVTAVRRVRYRREMDRLIGADREPGSGEPWWRDPNAPPDPSSLRRRREYE